MKKKFLSIMACLAVILVGGVALSACGTSSTTADVVSLTSGSTYFDETPSVTYANSSTVKMTKDGTTYTISGTAAQMTTEQADTFWNGVAAAGDYYVVVTFQVKVGETFSFTSDEEGKGTVSFANTDADATDTSVDVIIRISGTSSKGTESRTYTISGDVDTTYTIAFDASVIPSVD